VQVLAVNWHMEKSSANKSIIMNTRLDGLPRT
jgi:hypothetical protein